MATAVPFTPTISQAGFTAWVSGVMGVPAAWMPTDPLSIFYAYNTAVSTVNPAFAAVPGPIYLQMCYNLGGHLLATWAPDAGLRHRILVDNPAMLYGFPSA